MQLGASDPRKLIGAAAIGPCMRSFASKEFYCVREESPEGKGSEGAPESPNMASVNLHVAAERLLSIQEQSE